ncbi:hypothetical protein V6N13_024954 [Hibiscus sabdariffa]|uniref:Uncharacterized protein n=1 Tax=Hibiscus sabdariffa TaxID=183260 RepID=A0ABR2AA75_9ROSI
MASNSFLQHLSDLDFTNEEQGVVFTPPFKWNSTIDDSNLLIIGKLVSSRAIDDLAVYGDWLRYIPAKRQDLVSRSKDSIQYLDANSSTPNLTKTWKNPEPSKTDVVTNDDDQTLQPVNPSNLDTAAKEVANASKHDTDVESSNVVLSIAVTQPLVVLAAGKADASTNDDADDAATTVEEGVTLPTTPNSSPVNLIANGNATIPLTTAPTQNATITTSPILDNDMGKFLLPIWEVLAHFDDWMLNGSTNLAATNNTIPPTQASRGNKRRSSMPDTSMTKRPSPPPPSNVKAGMSNKKKISDRG